MRRTVAAAITHGKPSPAPASRALLGTTKRKDGNLEVTYGGHPLYYFVTDRKPGQTTGQGVNQFGGPWWVISPGARRSTVASAPAHCNALRFRAVGPGVELATSRRAARYLGAVSILLVGAVHAQQYYDAYFSVVPTIGTLFLLSFIGAGVVGAPCSPRSGGSAGVSAT